MWERVRGEFDDSTHAERAAAALVDRGARHCDIEVARTPSGTRLGRWVTLTTPEDGWLGARSGLVAGVLVGILAAVVTLLLPGIGQAFGSGAVPWLLAGVLQVGVGGAIVGGAIGFLVDLGAAAPASERRGAGPPATVSVTLSASHLATHEVVQTLRKYGARSVGTDRVSARLDCPAPARWAWLERWLPPPGAAQRGPEAFRPWVLEVAASRETLAVTREPLVVEHIRVHEGGTQTEDMVVPVVAEDMRVERQAVRTGGVRVVKTVDTTWHDVQEILQREDVSVERVPIGREVPVVPPTRLEGDVVVVPVVEESLVVRKVLILKEEVRIRRHPGTYTSHQEVPLRREVARLETLSSEDLDVSGAEQPADPAPAVEAARDGVSPP